MLQAHGTVSGSCYGWKFTHDLSLSSKQKRNAKYSNGNPFDQSSWPDILIIAEYVPTQAITSPRIAMQMQIAT